MFEQRATSCSIIVAYFRATRFVTPTSYHVSEVAIGCEPGGDLPDLWIFLPKFSIVEVYSHREAIDLNEQEPQPQRFRG